VSNSAFNPTFDLIAIQTMNSAIVGTLRHSVPVGEALEALTAERIGGDLGPGVVPALIATTEPLYQVRNELERARGKHAPLNSAHEAYAVILEELDEFKAGVWKKRAGRDPERMRAELIQIAAMAIRAVEDLEL
jgi:hypothetical protein